MKATSPQGKALVDRFNAMAVGQPTDFATPFPNLSAEGTQAVLTEKVWDDKIQKGYWLFALYWHGTHLSDVSAEVVEGELSVEVL